MEKPVAGSLCLILNVHGKCFSLKARIQKFSKLVEISCLQEIKSKLTFIPLCLTCFIQTCQLCVPTIMIVKVSFKKNIFWCGCCSLLIVVAKKSW